MTDTPSFDDLLDFSGKTVVVTGAATGIGRAVAEAFAAKKARVALLDRDPAVSDVAASLGAGHFAHVVDVTDEAGVERAVAAVTEAFGPIDILVNNAGIGPLAPAESYPTAEWDRTLAINLKGAFLMARAVAPGMLERKAGRIVNMA
jgi:NAD(P)-dependent dehydrogenase (short-subunit alcohol dehydrogenase family)